MKEIPKIIHFVFLNTKEPIPQFFKKCLKRTEKFHPGWEVIIYDKHDAERIIKEYVPELLPIYNGYGHYVQRADIIRAILVFVFGGFYMDLDMFCLKSLDGLLTNQLIIPQERNIPSKWKKRWSIIEGISVKHELRLGNYMFGGIPKHPFWLFYFKESLKVASMNVKTEGDILESTGPSLLTRVYHTYKYHFPEITILKNSDRWCLCGTHKEISCHFGNYAAHIHQGTWRWQHIDRDQSFNNTISPEVIKNGVFLLNKRIEKIHMPNVSFISFDKENKSFVTDFLSKQFQFSIKRHDIEDRNVIFLNLNSLDNLKKSRYSISNTLIITEPFSTLSNTRRNIINQKVSLCIVFSRIIKKQLQSFGINSPIEVADCFYLPVKRDFSEEESESLYDFAIGVYSDLSDESLKILSDLSTSLRKKCDNIYLIIFYQPKADANVIRHNSSLRFLSMKSNNLSKEMNALSCFLSLYSSIEEEIMVKSCLYLGVPAMVGNSRGFKEKTLLKFCKAIRINNLSKAIFDFKDNYEFYNIQSLSAAKYLEDTFSLENISYKIISRTMQL